ncbi:MAG TPA: hypothetical protein VF240_09800 [Pyrinomonadaceae bacterium]
MLVLATGVSLSVTDLAFGQQTGTGGSDSGQGFPIPPESRLDPLNNFTKATFQANLNTVFRINAGASNAVELTLIEVSNIGPVPDQTVAGRECFVLRFSGPLNQPLPQRTYLLEQDALGSFDLFIVPGKKDKKWLYYHAVINRLNP